jgi:hypothetical protein
MNLMNRMILGYIGGQDRIYLIDKSLTVVSYELLQSVINYQTYVINGNIQMANTVFFNSCFFAMHFLRSCRQFLNI